MLLEEEAHLETELPREGSSQEAKVLKMMVKQGWEQGSGLGKYQQGMVTPLAMVKKTESQAVIVNQPTQLIPSRVLMLTNLVSLQ